MDFGSYLNQLPKGGKTELAKRLKVPLGYLSRMVSGERPITPARALDIERETAGKVTRQDTRPNDWWVIWPELANGNTRRPAA